MVLGFCVWDGFRRRLAEATRGQEGPEQAYLGLCLSLFGCWLKVPVGVREEFLARVGVLNRVKVPVLVRWRNKLRPGEVLTVTVREDRGSTLGLTGTFA